MRVAGGFRQGLRHWAALIPVFLGVGLLIGAGSAAATAGHRKRDLIVGGQPVPAGLFPQLAFIQDEVSPGNYIACSGTVLSSNVVLTAAHCVGDETTGAVRPAVGSSSRPGSRTGLRRRPVS